jgi:UPF0716 protein FxsA
MINVAKWALFTILALPFLELAVFIVVAVGFSWALGLVLAGSAPGSLIFRHAGGNHFALVRVALGQDNVTSLRAHQSGGFVLIAGILLLIPGFITDIVALCLLIPLFRKAIHKALGYAVIPTRNDGVVDLGSDQ